MDTLKICTGCKLQLPIEKFSWQNKKLLIKRPRCKNCLSIYYKNHYSNNKEKYQIAQKKHYSLSANKDKKRARSLAYKNSDLEGWNERKRKCAERRPHEKKILSSARDRAREQNLSFSIKEKDIIIPKLCPVLGIPLQKAKGQPNNNSPSIDRINPKFGYIPSNIRIISYRANMLKNNATLAELELILIDMRNLVESNLFSF